MAKVAVVGAGPAGLMAAETLACAGVQVDVFDAMASAGRKFLLAGKGGLNLTHSEPLPAFVQRYGAQSAQVASWLDHFGPQAVRDWADGLGQATFIGTSGRVFPRDMKAAPLLRTWLQRLRAVGVRFHMRHRWLGWQPGSVDCGALQFDGPQGKVNVEADSVVLALGGGSWPQLGSDGSWVPHFQNAGVDVATLKPSNCGFEVQRVIGPRCEGASPGWSDHFRNRYAGHPMKSVVLTLDNASAVSFRRPGEFVVTETGVEGSLIYAASSMVRDAIDRVGHATLHVDLLPARSIDWVASELAIPRGSRSLSTHLKSRLGLHGVKAGLLYELVNKADLADPRALAFAIKSLPINVVAARPLAEAISSAGGVRFSAVDEGLMLRAKPNVYCAGEMLDWEAPTGGYLLTACLASGRMAGVAAAAKLR